MVDESAPHDISDVASRRRKLNQLKEMGLNPYQFTHYETDTNCAELKKKYHLEPATHTEEYVRIAGRILTNRTMGKIAFLNLQDASDEDIQIVMLKNNLSEETWTVLGLLDLGDIIGLEGEVGTTKKGELSLFVKDFTILAKSLRPMPDKYHGIVDVEARYRHRYLDLMVNSQTRRMMRITDQVYHLMRSYLRKEGFIEVQVPILQKIYGGALANPFKTYSNALEQDVYLSIASELDLKRLIVGDMGKVFDISRDFRNEAIDSTHNPEFSMMECYAAFENYEYVMRLTENLISHISQEVLGSMKTTYQGNELDFSPPWDRVSMIQSIKDACGVDFYEITDYQEALEAGKENNIPIDQCFNRGQVIQKFFDSFVESNLIQPTFVYEFPVEISPLAKKSPKNPFIAERFEIFIGGLEIGNAFSELNDPDEQKERFMEQELLIENHDEKEAHPMDEDYINALEYGLAPTGGLGIGMERLIMILADLSSIKEALIFPQVRFSKTESEEKKE